MFSDYIFSCHEEEESEIRSSSITFVKNIFYFDNFTSDSFIYLNSMIKYFQLESCSVNQALKIKIYYTPIKVEDISDINKKFDMEIKKNKTYYELLRMKKVDILEEMNDITE